MRLQLGKTSLFVFAVMLILTAVAHAGSIDVNVSSPASGITVSSPVSVKASATSSYPVTGWQIYVDDKPVWKAGTTSSISASIPLSSGSHKIYVRAWNSSGAYDTSGNRWVTVKSGTSGSGSVSTTGEPFAPSGALLIDNIDQKSGWAHCSDCAANPSDPTPPLASWSFSQWQNTPSKDGSSMKMSISGSTPYANVLHYIKFGDKSAYRNFIWEFWIYGNSDMNNAQNLEFDLWQSVSNRKYMFGTQCNYWKKIWQGWDETLNKWIDTSIPCPKFPTGQWTRVKWYFQRTWDSKLHYVSVTVNNTTYKVDRYWPSKSTSWANSSGIHFQQDMNGSAADYTMWADRVRVWMW
jgi:hypothetical protein